MILLDEIWVGKKNLCTIWHPVFAVCSNIPPDVLSICILTTIDNYCSCGFQHELMWIASSKRLEVCRLNMTFHSDRTCKHVTMIKTHQEELSWFTCDTVNTCCQACMKETALSQHTRFLSYKIIVQIYNMKKNKWNTRSSSHKHRKIRSRLKFSHCGLFTEARQVSLNSYQVSRVFFTLNLTMAVSW